MDCDDDDEEIFLLNGDDDEDFFKQLPATKFMSAAANIDAACVWSNDVAMKFFEWS